MKSTGGCALRISAGFLREMKKEAGCSGLQRCSQQSLQDRADRSIFSIGSGAAAVKRKNSRKMQKFRKQESTNISPRKVRFCLTSVLQIIIMKKLHRGVAQMVARMVRDHEAASSSLATPTKKNPVISMVTGFFVFFGAAKLASGSTKKVNKFGFFDKKTAQRQSLSGNFFIFSQCFARGSFIRSSSAASLAVFKRCSSGIYLKNSVSASASHSKSLESI